MNAIALRPSAVQRRLAVALWLAGMLGVVVLTWQFLPQMIARQMANIPLPIPIEVLMLISAAQSGILLALAVWAGLSLAAPVGLRAPVFEAWAERGDLAGAWRPQLLPGVLGGLAGGAWLLLLARFQPTELAQLADTVMPPIAARLLYGGITEELLMRWGLMSATLWALQHWVRGIGRPTAVVLAILATSLLFGVLHLPAAQVMLGTLTLPVVGFVIVGNLVAGGLFGWLFWRHGLEAAMLAHAGTHLTVWLAVA